MQLPASPVRQLLVRMLTDALEAAHGGHALQRAIHKSGDVLTIGSRRYDLRKYRRVVVVGAGKAAGSMARAIEPILGRRLDGGCVVTKYGHTTRTKRIRVVEAGHPVPDRAGLAAARGMLSLVSSLTDEDLLIVLLSGGASSLLPAPVSGVRLADKQHVTKLLLWCGAGIGDINSVRKHLSNLKGGRLAASTDATILTLILSDVIGDDISTIASGPTAPDPSTYQDAIDCLRHYRLWTSVSRSIRTHLRRGVEGQVTETPKTGTQLFERVHHAIIGNNSAAVACVISNARSVGLRTVLLPPLIQEARASGAYVGSLARSILTKQEPVASPCCIVAGGETTVKVMGAGRGGRAQEFAVAAAKVVAGLPNVYVAGVGTDGTDGPTDAAGAFIDGDTWHRATRLGIDLNAALRQNNTYRALKRLGSHIITGPTGTNVNDLYLLFVL
jgi:glycerate 2-kinase